MKMIPRHIEPQLKNSIQNFPITAIIGPRQVGKSTIVKQLVDSGKKYIYLDLERPSDVEKLHDAERYFQIQQDKLICLDEIQLRPDLFPLIRSLVDEWAGEGHFLITGSASPELLRQSSESLAGRIVYHRLCPFLWNEIEEHCSMDAYILRGGFPRSLLASDDVLAMQWLDSFVVTFLERDLSFWTSFSLPTMRRLWQMLAHLNGQQLNYSSLGNSLGISNTSIKNYVDLLEATFMVKSLTPYFSNVGKRIVKAPKLYITDTGIINSLLGLQTFEQLFGHPVFGSLWETVVLNNLMGIFPNAIYSYYRTSNGAEIDIIVEWKGKIIAIECKNTLTPKLKKGNYNAIEDIQPDFSFVVAPVKEGWPVNERIEVVSLNELLRRLTGIFENSAL